MAQWQTIDGGVTAPKGFRASGVAVGLKASGLPDLALIVSDVPAIAAGAYTTSQVRAACVDYCHQKLQNQATAQVIVCNSGQANAATGEQGWTAVTETTAWIGEALNIPHDMVLAASTGVIGKQIPLDIFKAGIPALISALSETGGDAAAKAILTTDLVTKAIALEGIIGGKSVRIGGMAKGSGMIHPNMATMLGFITCDAAVSPDLWQGMLSRAVGKSFNQITVDGDTSTNDTVLAMANGASQAPEITEVNGDHDQLEAMLTEVCMVLAKAIARDGEGATTLMEIQVQGTDNDADARKIALTIAGSMLVKSAVFGRDPNWGRIAGAAGRAGVTFNATQLAIQLGDFVLMDQGTPQDFERDAASAYLKQDPVIIKVSVGRGSGQGIAWGCDLSYDYVRINAEYTT